MRELIYYILAAVGGGIMSEINTEGLERKKIRHYFIRGFTSVMIGVIFGLLFKELTGNVNITIAITALAGVSGITSVEWLTQLLKEKAKNNLDSKPKKNGN